MSDKTHSVIIIANLICNVLFLVVAIALLFK